MVIEEDRIQIYVFPLSQSQLFEMEKFANFRITYTTQRSRWFTSMYACVRSSEFLDQKCSQPCLIIECVVVLFLSSPFPDLTDICRQNRIPTNRKDFHWIHLLVYSYYTTEEMERSAYSTYIKEWFGVVVVVNIIIDQPDLALRILILFSIRLPSFLPRSTSQLSTAYRPIFKKFVAVPARRLEFEYYKINTTVVSLIPLSSQLYAG